MSKQFKKVCAIHDLSCFGRCALTVIIPTMSRLGCQVVPIPTALLSTHTGGFTGIKFTALTHQMRDIADHLKELNVSFDALFTGFLGSEHQIETVEYIINEFIKENTVFLLDPVMGDDGKLYSTYNTEMVDGIRHLSTKAHILTPNLTEACLLLDRPYPDFSSISSAEVEKTAEDILNELCSLYPKANIVITGINCKDKILTVCKSKNGNYATVENELQPISFPGTGDLFASLLLSKIMLGSPFFECVKYASNMTSYAVKFSQGTDEEIRCGILLEKFLYETEL